MRYGLVVTVCFAVVTAARAQSIDPRIAQARTLLDDLDPQGALKVLEAVDKTPSLSHASVVALLELQGMAWGTLGKDAMVRDSFRKLLMLAPDTPTPVNAPPRVRTPFFEAREWASRHGPTTLELSAEPAQDGTLTLIITVSKDVYRAAKKARVHVEGQPDVVQPLDHGVARVSLPVQAARWSAQALGDRDQVLLESAERSDGQVTPVATPEAPPAPVSVVQTPVAPTLTWRRPLGIALLGAGVAAVVTGSIFGVLSSEGRARLTPGADGVISAVTQRDAASLAASVQLQATVANALFISGGVLAAAGLVFTILGPAEAPVVALSPTPGGMVVHGAF